MFQGFLGGTLIDNDPDQERDPPKDPTPVTFPTYEASNFTQWIDGTSFPDLQAIFSRISKPTDISHLHREALNIELVEGCRIEDLLPTSDGISFLPPPTTDQNGSTNSSTEVHAKARNMDTSPEWKDYEQRRAELMIDNDLAFRSLTRRLPHGTKPYRLLHSRKFWVGLESMSSYWDCSLDEFSERPDAHETTEQKSVKRHRPNSVTPDSLPKSLSSPLNGHTCQKNCGTISILNNDIEVRPGETRPHNIRSDTEDATRIVRSTSASPEPTLKTRYKGRRLGTGRDMPDQFRVDTVRGLVECATFAFKCSLCPPRRMPVVQLEKLKVPVRQTAAVYRPSQDRTKARAGCHEGPIVGVQVRSETDFSLPECGPQLFKSRLDLMREFGGLLQLAQERRREDKTEVKPGEDMWYTTVPRWGGGPGGAMEERTNSDVLASTGDPTGRQSKDKDTSSSSSSKSRTRRSPAFLWQELKCGSGFWDNRTEYKAIGKSPSSQYDEIFLVSSLNTHLAILKLTVHVAYTDSLVSGTFPSPAPPAEDPEWSRPRLQRTQWFDLFDTAQRAEAFRALWGVMGYLMRAMEEEEKG